MTAQQFRQMQAKPKTRKANPEYKIQAAFVREMQIRYPAVMVQSDTAAHIGKTMRQQMRANLLSTPGERWPDIFIAQPSGEYAGMYIEFKAESPYKKDGATLLKNEHIEAQAATMQRLRERGYFVPDFVWSVEMAMRHVEWYLNL
jgi:hypothetical protein